VDNILNPRYEDEVGDISLFEIEKSSYRISYSAFLNMIQLRVERTNNNSTLVVELILDQNFDKMPDRYAHEALDFINLLLTLFWDSFQTNQDYYKNGNRISRSVEQSLKLIQRDFL
jgi:hypothetical protein